jgi:hypothetical protein
MPRSASRTLLDKLPSPEEMRATINNLKRQSDAAIALISIAYLDHALELLLKAEFKPVSATDEARIFDSARNGILGTFSSKIRIAHAMGLTVTTIYPDMILINDIRNVFGHSLHSNVKFTHELIIKDCENLKCIVEFEKMRGDKPKKRSPKNMFVDTVQHIYGALIGIAESKAEEKAEFAKIVSAMQRVANRADASVPAPSPDKRQRRSRNNPPPT